MAWDVVQREGPVYQALDSTDLDLKSLITSTLEAVPRAYWEQARDQSLAVRSTLFGLCVSHSILLMRHQLGTRASSGRYPLSTCDLLTAFEMVIGWATRQDGLSASQLEALSEIISKECQWFNCLLYYIRHSLQVLEHCVLGGSPAIPPSLASVVDSLQCHMVPTDWLHPDSQPSPHILTSWLKDLNRRHKQLSDWVRRGIVPNPNSEPLIGRGHLTSVWLGGLANPGALMTSLRHEKAAMVGCSVDEVELRCSLAKSYLSRDENVSDSEQGLVISGLYLEGASMDLDKEYLVEPTSAISQLPDLFVSAVIPEEEEPRPEDRNEEDDLEVYRCPVFMNRARQCCSFTLPMKCSKTAEHWVLAGVAIVLDIGDASNSWKLVPSNFKQ